MSAIRGRRWQPDWRLWLVALCFLPLLIGLGVWQWQRAQEKSELFAQWREDQPVPWSEVKDPVEGQPVALMGQFDSRFHWLLDNRTREGRPGYAVLSLFYPDSGGAVVVNRGWTPAPQLREELPQVSGPDGPQRLIGRVASWPQPPIVGEAAPSEGWPRRVQALSAEQVRQESGRLPQGIVRLTRPGPGSYQVRSDPGVMPPQRHKGYAVQWFSLALALVVLTLVASFRKVESDRE